MAGAAIGLGTNLGDRLDNLARALEAMPAAGCSAIIYSRIYRSEPIGLREQPDFWNMAALCDTMSAPHELLDRLHAIERRLGRERSGPAGGPRVIDLDLLLYNNRVIDARGLRIPHPRMHARAFVLRPLCEIAAQRMHPVFGRTIRELLTDVEAQRAEPLDDESAQLRARLGHAA